MPADTPLIGALLVFAGLALLGGTVLSLQRRRISVRHRVRRLTRSARAAPALHDVLAAGHPEGTVQGRATPASALLRRLERALRRRAYRGGPVRFLALSALSATGGAVALVVAGLTLPLAGLAGLFLGPLIVLKINARRASARARAARAAFPGALEIISRSMEAGLSLEDAFRLVASEGPPPMNAAFRMLLEEQQIGFPISEACARMADRLGFEEMEFFAIVVAVQRDTGGSILHAFGALSETITERRALKQKIAVASQEAKASAMIIGALPFLVAGGLYLSNPEFIGVLFTTAKGQVATAFALGLMAAGTLIMREMIRFDE